MSERERNEILLNVLLFLLFVGTFFSCLGGVYLYNMNKDCPEINITTVELNSFGDGAIYGNVEPKNGRTIEAIGKPQNTGPGTVTLETAQTESGKVRFTIHSKGNLWGKIKIAFRDSGGCLVKETISCGLQEYINIGIRVLIAIAWLSCTFICWRIYEVWRRKGEEA